MNIFDWLFVLATMILTISAYFIGGFVMQKELQRRGRLLDEHGNVMPRD